MVTRTAPLPQAGPADGAARAAPRPGSIAYWLSGALALSAAASSLLTFLIPDVLRGPAVMNGSARGTALVVLLAGVPVLGCSLLLAWRGSARATVTWLGSAAFLLYNSVMFVFETPANRLFPLYLAMLSLSVWSIGTLAWQADVRVLAMRFSPRVPIRGIAAYVWVVVALNSAGWLTRIGPAIAHGGAPAYLRGTGLTTNVVYVQDLAWWLPLMALAAAWLWRRQPRGYLIVSAGLVMWVIESISIAVDQWYGHAADPASAVASAALVPAFAGIALTGLVPIYYLLRDFGHGQPASISGCAVPFADRRTWPAWMLAIVAAIVGAGAVVGGTQLLSNGYGMPLSWLGHTPLTSWLLPGLALLIGVAVPQLTVLALVTLANRWALFAGYLAGVALVAWIAVQLLVLQRYFFLQPVIACLGVLQVALARAWQRKTSGRSPRRTAAPGQAFGRLLVAIDRGTDVPAGEAMANRRIARGVVDALGALPFFVTAPLYRHWHQRWGATNEEAVGAMPGDELVPNPAFNATRAITIDAPPGRVWPWIVQMGYRRAGFYTYALLDNAGRGYSSDRTCRGRRLATDTSGGECCRPVTSAKGVRTLEVGPLT